ncbi:MAG TPA: DUF1697 domain-containing protein [Longimicrobiaceae bacterium]|nr:DUF1697 domain-containing protein [Longimicrobiaceae bacterium]
MQRYVAFLRAINVGGHTVKMDRLRGLFGELGLAGVETFIASGNVIFETAEGDLQGLERRIERHLRQALGYEVATFIRSASELTAIAAHRPFPASETEGALLYVALLPSPPDDEALRRLLAFRSEVDDFHVHGREVYWLCRKKTSESAFSGALLERALGMPATLRNVTTLRKLADRYGRA